MSTHLTQPKLSPHVTLVAGGALFLASDASGWITGIIVDVAGGMIR